MAGKIIKVAVLLDGVIHVGQTGHRHGDVIQKLHDEGILKDSSVNGFVDENGLFLNRTEAYYRALEMKQIKEFKTPCLLSEDVW